jgi:hypothetical protein
MRISYPFLWDRRQESAERLNICVYILVMPGVDQHFPGKDVEHHASSFVENRAITRNPDLFWRMGASASATPRRIALDAENAYTPEVSRKGKRLGMQRHMFL